MTGVPRQIGPEDVPEVVETLVLAFADDPILRWWITDERRRREIVPAFFSILVEAFLPARQIWSLDSASAALWVPPGLPKPTEEESTALNDAMATACGEYAAVGNEISAVMDAVHPTEDHMYLWFLGSRPGFQGQGLGSALLREVLDRCDADGVPAYLEATGDDNRRLYRRHGFVDIQQIAIRDSPPLFCMWRDPR